MTEETNQENTKVEKKKKKQRSKAVELVETLIIAFFLAFLIRVTVAEARFIPSSSMEPTLQIGDRLIIEKVSSYFVKPSRGSILVFYPPHAIQKKGWVNDTLRKLTITNEMAYIKRVVGLPGETVEVKEGKVFINGKPLIEDYTQEPPFYTYPPLKVPEDSLFMMGDNRNNSQDSHLWGPLPIKNIIGQAIVRFWPPQRIGSPS